MNLDWEKHVIHYYIIVVTNVNIVEMLALIIECFDKQFGIAVPYPTLILPPRLVVSQWEQQILSHTKNVKVFISYYIK